MTREEFNFPDEMEVFEEENEMQLWLGELARKVDAILKHMEKGASSYSRVYYEDGELKSKRCNQCVHHETIDFPVCCTNITCPSFERQDI